MTHAPPRFSSADVSAARIASFIAADMANTAARALTLTAAADAHAVDAVARAAVSCRSKSRTVSRNTAASARAAANSAFVAATSRHISVRSTPAAAAATGVMGIAAVVVIVVIGGEGSVGDVCDSALLSHRWGVAMHAPPPPRFDGGGDANPETTRDALTASVAVLRVAAARNVVDASASGGGAATAATLFRLFLKVLTSTAVDADAAADALAAAIAAAVFGKTLAIAAAAAAAATLIAFGGFTSGAGLGDSGTLTSAAMHAAGVTRLLLIACTNGGANDADAETDAEAEAEEKDPPPLVGVGTLEN